MNSSGSPNRCSVLGVLRDTHGYDRASTEEINTVSGVDFQGECAGIGVEERLFVSKGLQRSNEEFDRKCCDGSLGFLTGDKTASGSRVARKVLKIPWFER